MFLIYETVYVISNMTNQQADIVSFYTGASIVGFCVCIIYLVLFRIVSFVKKSVLSSDKTSHAAMSTVPFRALNGPSGFIPIVQKPELLYPVMCCDIQKLPTSVLPLDDTRNERLTAKSVSVCNSQEFSDSAKVDVNFLTELFGCVVYYEDPDISFSAPASEPTDGTDQVSLSNVLPVGWEIASTRTGKFYYVDHNAKKTYWKLPTSSVDANFS